jgi:uncharacterized protein involved in outer membrane biogenesis
MKIPRQLIEKKLSQFLGAQVTFDRLDVSLAGKLEAEGMTVAGDGQPLARVRRIAARVALGQLLAGQIAAKSIEVEEPRIFLSWRGRAFQLPRPASNPDDSAGQSNWKFDVQSIRITDGQIDFQIPAPEAAYHISAEKINAELTQSDKIAGQVSIGSVRRLDVPVELGSIKLTTRIDGTGTFFDQPIEIEIQFSDVAQWQAALPADLSLPAALSRLKFDGPVEARVRLEIDAAGAIRIYEANIRAAGAGGPGSAF